ncbi:MAG: hypothetical protein HDR43_02770 [Mycoplasma sp.]|nr:hypothetical protein [Mycoplasma sp.]
MKKARKLLLLSPIATLPLLSVMSCNTQANSSQDIEENKKPPVDNVDGVEQEKPITPVEPETPEVKPEIPTPDPTPDPTPEEGEKLPTVKLGEVKEILINIAQDYVKQEVLRKIPNDPDRVLVENSFEFLGGAEGPTPSKLSTTIENLIEEVEFKIVYRHFNPASCQMSPNKEMIFKLKVNDYLDRIKHELNKEISGIVEK